MIISTVNGSANAASTLRRFDIRKSPAQLSPDGARFGVVELASERIKLPAGDFVGFLLRSQLLLLKSDLLLLIGFLLRTSGERCSVPTVEARRFSERGVGCYSEPDRSCE